MFKYRRSRTPNCRGGVVTVEMAICLPLLLTFTLIMLEFSRVHMLRQCVSEAAYQAARAIKVPGATASEATPAVTAILGAVGAQNFTVQVQPSTITAGTEFVSVTVTLPFAGNSWASPIFFQNGQISGVANLKTERFRLSSQ